MPIYQFLTILLISVLPFFPKQLFDPHIRPFIIIFAICILPVFFGAFIEDIKRKFIPTICFIVFLICATISTVFSVNIKNSADQLFLFFSYFVVTTSIRVIFPTLRSKEFLVSYYCIIVFCLSLISFYNTFIRHYANRTNVGFLWVYFGHNHLSGLLIFAIPFCLYILLTHWNNNRFRLPILSIFCFFLISLLLTLSIGAMIALALSFFIIIFFIKKSFPFKKNFFVVFFILAFFSLSSLYFFSTNKRLNVLHLKKNPYNNVATRFVYWQRAFDNFVQKPLTGTGLDTFYIGREKTPPFSRYAHNFFIHMLSDAGIFGFLSSIGLIGAVILHAYNAIKMTSDRKIRSFYIFILIGMLSSVFMAMIDVDWHIPTAFLFFWIFAGLLRKNVN